ncbi:MAG TPA: metallophosphoesterase [Rhodocyclaceae bacterium]|nr:metallophosphoesterase [Rhodocyclaceae bacterium]
MILAVWALPAAAEQLTLFVIGDTGDCDTGGAGKVSAALRAQPDWQSGWLIEVGDLAYPVATRERLLECHEPHFSMFSRRLAAPGNHDWYDPGARGFFSLFPDPVPRAVDLDGRWRLWLLDSNLRGDAWNMQVQWLDDAVKQAAGRCVIAAWHHPRWSSSLRGGSSFVAPLWERTAGVAVLSLHGHDHHYEAMSPLDKAGRPADGGTRSFIVGNGGAKLYPVMTGAWPSKAVANRWGFLRIDIQGDRYDWQALDVDGERLDAGSGQCNSA